MRLRSGPEPDRGATPLIYARRAPAHRLHQQITVRSFLTISLLALTACGTDHAPDDTSWVLPELAPAEGFSVRTPAFPVAPGAEIQDCYFFRVPDLGGGESLMIDRIALGLNAGSHHMNVFRVNTIVGLDPAQGAPVDLGRVQGTVIRGADGPGCWNGANWADWPLVANSQDSGGMQKAIDWALPAGVAEKFQPGEMLMLQLHYVNTTDQVTPEEGQGGVNFYRSTDGDHVELGTLFATQKKVRVCRSNPRPSYSAHCALPAGAHTVIAANGHFHSRGTDFRMWTWDGSTMPPADANKFYESGDWSEPKMETALDVSLPANGGVWWTCDYQWQEPAIGCAAIDAADPLHANDCCYTFGPSVDTNEHCNAFVYYYPKAAEPPACE